MIALEMLRDYTGGGFVIPLWEIVFYLAVMGLYAFMGRAQSCLINSFAFAFYWGFMYLLPKAFSDGVITHTVLMTYALSGVGIYVLATAIFLTGAPKKQRVRCNISGGGFL